MRAVMVMFDSLNRRMLPNYGNNWVAAPNFERLGQRTVTFDNCYVGSMPCMPARRELHTGRLNFLHRSWGPIEPFDDSMPEILKQNSVYSHLISDHYHYWEDGGATYHNRYSSWECVRGQEGDHWKADLDPSIRSVHCLGALLESDHTDLMSMERHDSVNRQYMANPSQSCLARTFSKGIHFLETNYKYDNWFLQIEAFDPHEPFFASKEYRDIYEANLDAIDWPYYGPVHEGEPCSTIDQMRKKYAALVSMCDHYLGKILDFMDGHDMWKDTMLIVNTDHGILLGEHNWWLKTKMPLYNEIAHIPLFIWDPRESVKGVRRDALVQTIDLPATILDYFSLPLPEHMEGRPLRQVIRNNTGIRDYALMGYFGKQVNITDGRYVYMRNSITRSSYDLYEYTLMPTHIHSRMSVNELKNVSLEERFSFTKGIPILKIQVDHDDIGDICFPEFSDYRFGTRLYDLELDPSQQSPISDEVVELRMMNAMAQIMLLNDAPTEQFERLGLQRGIMTMDYVHEQNARVKSDESIPGFDGYEYTSEVLEVLRMLPKITNRENALSELKEYTRQNNIVKLDWHIILDYVQKNSDQKNWSYLENALYMASRVD